MRMIRPPQYISDHRRYRVVALAALVCIAGCGDKGLALEGTVTVDGKPVDSGTIQFQPSAPARQSAPTSTGCAVEAGTFHIPASRRLTPGTYRVTIVGVRYSGRKVRDPQRGQIDERIPIKLSDAPIEITISPDNAHSLDIAATSSR
jgi:hypothetical protein